MNTWTPNITDLGYGKTKDQFNLEVPPIWICMKKVSCNILVHKKNSSVLGSIVGGKLFEPRSFWICQILTEDATIDDLKALAANNQERNKLDEYQLVEAVLTYSA